MTTSYRYLFADLLTNAILAELPLTGVTFAQQLNTIGTATGHILLSGVNSVALNVSDATIPARTALYIDRNGVLVWGGIIWGRTYNSATQTLTFQAREFMSYFEHRRIVSNLVFNNVDQLQIAQSIVIDMESETNGDIGLLYNQDSGSSIVSGVLVSRTFYSYELKSVMSAVQDLSQQSSGFDFEISVYYDGDGNPAKSFNTYYPRTGKIYTTTSLNIPVFIFPSGNIVEYEYPEDGLTVANTVYALGAGSNEGKLVATATDATKIAAGWPLLETQSNFSDITDGTLLANLASAQVKAVSYPPTTLKIVAPPFVDPAYGTYEIGDDVRVIITDERFPTTLDTTYRLVALSVQAGEDGPERVTLTLTIGTV